MSTLLAVASRAFPNVLLAFVLAWPIGAAAERLQGSGVARTETRTVSGFHRIALGINADVELRQGASEGVVITGDDNVVPRIETRVESGTLHIRWNDRNLQPSYERLRLVVSVRELDELTIGGAGSVHAERLQATALKATLGGSGRVAIDQLDARAAGVTLAGSGVATIAGRVDTFDATLAGSGELNAGKLAARSGRVTLQGSGRAVVRASDRLDVTIAGSGDVVYYGKPAVSKTVLGSGRVSAAGE